jgi:hypothetical protein
MMFGDDFGQGYGVLQQLMAQQGANQQTGSIPTLMQLAPMSSGPAKSGGGMGGLGSLMGGMGGAGAGAAGAAGGEAAAGGGAAALGL